MVVLALLFAVVLGGLLISLVGAVRSPDDVSNSATILGTFPQDPSGPGIPPPGTEPPGTGVTGASVPGLAASPTVVDPFDSSFTGWETTGEGWMTAGGELAVPPGTPEDPAVALRPGDSAEGIGAEVGSSIGPAGLVVGYVDPGTYVAAVLDPASGTWTLEVARDGEVRRRTVEAPSDPGTTVQLAVVAGQAGLVIDGVEVATLAASGEAGGQVGFVSRGPGQRWAALVEGPEA